MRTAPLGRSGLDVSVVGLGCNNFGRKLDLDGTRAVVEAALDAGITHFDTAHLYGEGNSEVFLGEALAGRRDEVVLATKFGARMEDSGDLRRGSRELLRKQFAESLERLRTDRVDLLYYHHYDGETPIAETVGAMQELVDEGAVGALGVSNFTVAQLREALAVAPIAALQNEYSLLKREPEAELIPFCAEHGVGFVPYFPLASGRLTGKYRRDEAPPEGSRVAAWGIETSDEAWDTIERLEAFAAARGHSVLELAIAGLASRPGVASVIAGATTPEQVRANAAAGEWQLGEEELAAL
jgi:aryl-alcohol dehydrogenase-like predicted oxidoreductase